MSAIGAKRTLADWKRATVFAPVIIGAVGPSDRVERAFMQKQEFLWKGPVWEGDICAKPLKAREKATAR